MPGPLFESPRAQMAVKTLAIVIGFVQLNLIGLRYVPEILDRQMANSAQLGCYCAEHRVVGVAGITGMIAWHQIILKVPRGEVTGIVDVKAAAVVVIT